MGDIGGRETVTRLARTSGGGGSIYDPEETSPAEVFEGCVVYPRGGPQEASDRAVTAIAGYTVLFPSLDADIRSEDRLMWRGIELEVIGHSGRWAFLDGDDAALQVTCKQVTG